jgi:hypothetical protein
MKTTPNKRNEDRVAQSRFRSDRMFQDGDSWFFFTRECTIEGPFPGRIEATNQLDLYLKAMNSGLIDPESDLSLKPQ